MKYHVIEDCTDYDGRRYNMGEEVELDAAERHSTFLVPMEEEPVKEPAPAAVPEPDPEAAPEAEPPTEEDKPKKIVLPEPDPEFEARKAALPEVTVRHVSGTVKTRRKVAKKK